MLWISAVSLRVRQQTFPVKRRVICQDPPVGRNTEDLRENLGEYWRAVDHLVTDVVHTLGFRRDRTARVHKGIEQDPAGGVHDGDLTYAPWQICCLAVDDDGAAGGAWCGPR